MDANLALARKAKTHEESVTYYQEECKYPENLEVAPREPNLRGFLYYPIAKLHQELGNRDEADRLLQVTASESSDYPTIGSFYQALALSELGKQERADAILTELRKTAEALREGNAPGYGTVDENLREALGLYYSAKLEGDTERGRMQLEKSLSLEPQIERHAIIVAQLVYARAHQ